MHPMTNYFRDNVLQKRAYLRLDWCILALNSPFRKEIQPEDGRVRYYVWIEELQHYLRVVTLEDGITLHNAFPDRRFRP